MLKISVLLLLVDISLVHIKSANCVSEPVNAVKQLTPSFTEIVTYMHGGSGETLELELRDLDDNVIKTAVGTPERFNGTVPIVLIKGQYKVICCATGSTDRSVMYIEYNGIIHKVTEALYSEGFAISTNNVKQKRCLNLENLELISNNGNQEIFCRFSDKTLLGAGITLKVEKPNVACSNDMGIPNFSHKIGCNVTAIGGLSCQDVRWVFGKENHLVKTDRKRFTDQMYGTMWSSCTGSGNFLHTELIFRNLLSPHFTVIYYLVYGDGDSMSIRPLQIQVDTISSAGIVSSSNSVMVLLLCVICCIGI